MSQVLLLSDIIKCSFNLKLFKDNKTKLRRVKHITWVKSVNLPDLKNCLSLVRDVDSQHGADLLNKVLLKRNLWF